METNDWNPQARRKLLASVLLKFVPAMMVVALILFLSAGSLSYWHGWLYLGTMCAWMTIALVYLYTRAPGLLQERATIKEPEKEQKLYQAVSLVWSVVTFVVPGLDFRLGWSSVPVSLVVAALFVMSGGYFMFLVVMLQNRYASRVVKIQDGQTLIDTGLYSIVRHPLYMSATIMYAASPLVLGSYYGLLTAAALPLLLAYRIRNEEKVLMAGLPGYAEYTARVKYRLIPFVW